MFEREGASDAIRSKLLKAGIQDFYIEYTYDSLLKSDCFRIVISVEECGKLDKILKGVSENGTE